MVLIVNQHMQIRGLSMNQQRTPMSDITNGKHFQDFLYRDITSIYQTIQQELNKLSKY